MSSVDLNMFTSALEVMIETFKGINSKHILFQSSLFATLYINDGEKNTI